MEAENAEKEGGDGEPGESGKQELETNGEKASPVDVVKTKTKSSAIAPSKA